MRVAGGVTGAALAIGPLVGAAVLLAAFVAIERRAEAPMLPLSLFGIPAFAGTAVVAFAQSVALYPLLLFVAIYFQVGLGLSPTETGLRILPLTLVLVVVAPISGRLTNRLPLRVPLTAGLILIGAGLLLMRAVDAGSEWTTLLPGLPPDFAKLVPDWYPPGMCKMGREKKKPPLFCGALSYSGGGIRTCDLRVMSIGLEVG